MWSPVRVICSTRNTRIRDPLTQKPALLSLSLSLLRSLLTVTHCSRSCCNHDDESSPRRQQQSHRRPRTQTWRLPDFTVPLSLLPVLLPSLRITLHFQCKTGRRTCMPTAAHPLLASHAFMPKDERAFFSTLSLCQHSQGSRNREAKTSGKRRCSHSREMRERA